MTSPLEELRRIERGIKVRVNQQMKEFGRRAKKARTQAEMTQAEVARFAGVSRAQIANIESGRMRLSVDSMVRIAYYLGISLDEVFGTGKGTPGGQTGAGE